MKDLTVGEITNWLFDCLLGWMMINSFIFVLMLLFNIIHKLVY